MAEILETVIKGHEQTHTILYQLYDRHRGKRKEGIVLNFKALMVAITSNLKYKLILNNKNI